MLLSFNPKMLSTSLFPSYRTYKLERVDIVHSLIIFLIAISTVYGVSEDSIKDCAGFVEESSSLVSSLNGADGKLDYSHITVELQTVDGLVKDSTQCAPTGYYFIPVYEH